MAEAIQLLMEKKISPGEYGDDGRTSSCSHECDAIKLLMEKNIMPNLPPDALVDPNVFRNTRLYCEEVDTLLKRHANLLKALYSAYRGRPQSGGLRFKVSSSIPWPVVLIAGDAVR